MVSGVRQIRRTYGEITRDQPGWEVEARDGASWRDANFSAAAVAQRRDAIMSRGRGQ
jgi:hypothetical protein